MLLLNPTQIWFGFGFDCWRNERMNELCFLSLSLSLTVTIYIINSGCHCWVMPNPHLHKESHQTNQMFVLFVWLCPVHRWVIILLYPQPYYDSINETFTQKRESLCFAFIIIIIIIIINNHLHHTSLLLYPTQIWIWIWLLKEWTNYALSLIVTIYIQKNNSDYYCWVILNPYPYKESHQTKHLVCCLFGFALSPVNHILLYPNT